MSAFTSSLPDDLSLQLKTKAAELQIPRNKIIEKALRIYLDQINKAEYKISFAKLAQDDEIPAIAEEGMEDYLSNLDS